jgi:AcrR family transcriptional regulator
MAKTERKSLRVDAARNRDELVRIGAQLLASHGREFPFEEVAKAAGVGKGTLYRHFPTRDHLIAGVLQARFDDLAKEARVLVSHEHALDALEQWLRSFDRIPVKYRGLSARIGETLGERGSVVAEACGPMKEAFAKLVRRAQASGAIRAEVDPVELLSVVAALPQTVRNRDGSSRFLDVLLRGLRR